ncbi:UDP-3-O-acyl-N-acetylglucosamine deacetylase [Pseudosulfitobacter pseudonitzschiae]|uniref:UDP-3-O-acyl-N-acetylglucosamine deacetylase n=1 Tax=Pseudosulfitobacter pseudonitzschiae TaxID=1402135 RepID=UPI003B829D7B
MIRDATPGTVSKPVCIEGVGLHSGRTVSICIRPAPVGTGIVFRRTDIKPGTGIDPLVPARWDLVVMSQLCTLIRNAQGVEISTIEHIMAAFAGCGISNALVDIDSAEIPIMDGSASAFVAAIDAAGITDQKGPARALKILKPVQVSRPGAWCRLEPATEMEIDFTIDFSDEIIGHQHMKLTITPQAFSSELARSRTFCRLSDVEAMQARGLALGGSIDNSVVVDGERVLTPGGLRWNDEPVRHKILDAVGDLYLAGAPIMGRFTGMKSGHALTSSLLKKAFGEDGTVQYLDT